MPRPPILAYAEPELILSAIDNTSVHSDIDKLLLESKMLRGSEEFYNNSLETDYGKPYNSTSVPLNMRHYADIMKRANISKTLKEADVKSPFSAATYLELGEGDATVEDLQDSLLSRMERGDAPRGLVGYYEPLKFAMDMEGRDSKHQGLASAVYTKARDESAAPDTIPASSGCREHLIHLPAPELL